MALAVSVHQQQSARVRPYAFQTEMMSKEKSSPYPSPSSPPTAESRCSPLLSTTTPSWLLSTIADLEERVKEIEVINTEEVGPEDTFAQRAESYYRKRPQLLSLLRDLYDAYLSLSDRYFHGLRKRSSSNCVKQSPSHVSLHNLSDLDDGDVDSEVESSLSYQKLPSTPSSSIKVSADTLIAELVMKNVEHNMLLHEMKLMDRRQRESSRKMELQENLLEVLESERLILQSQNATLGFQVAALLEENRVLATESELMKARAAELARCVWKIREDGCVGELSSQIDDLQDRIFGLEKKNKEYYEEILRREIQLSGEKGGRDDTLLRCFEVEKWKLKKKRAARKKAIKDNKAGVGKRRASKWWTKVRKMDIFKCGISPTSGT